MEKKKPFFFTIFLDENYEDHELPSSESSEQEVVTYNNALVRRIEKKVEVRKFCFFVKNFRKFMKII